MLPLPNYPSASWEPMKTSTGVLTPKLPPVTVTFIVATKTQCLGGQFGSYTLRPWHDSRREAINDRYPTHRGSQLRALNSQHTHAAAERRYFNFFPNPRCTRAGNGRRSKGASACPVCIHPLRVRPRVPGPPLPIFPQSPNARVCAYTSPWPSLYRR